MSDSVPSVRLLHDDAGLWSPAQALVDEDIRVVSGDGEQVIGIVSWTCASKPEVAQLDRLRGDHNGPIVAILERLPTARGARAVSALLEGSVLADELEQALLPTLLAVAAGQCVVPGSVRQLLQRPPLSPRERQVLAMVVLDFSNAEIAEKLVVTESNVKSHLHEILTHSTMPRVELHWRVHWYEDRFAAAALERAERPDVRAPLRMLPADGLATLTLIYARDGLSGLRTPADIAAWWDTRCAGEDLDALIDSIGGDYPALEAPLRVGTAVLGPLVGLPTRSQAQPFRWKVAAEIATPFYAGGHAQVGANASLVDLLLAPPKGSRASLRRELQKVPKDLQRPLTRNDDLAVHRARWEHGLRLLRRWGLAAAPAAVRAYRQAPDRGLIRSGGERP